MADQSLNKSKEFSKTTPRKGKTKFVFTPPPEAPVFQPTAEQFENPLHYINTIKPLAEKCGICKIIPPAGWKSPFMIDMDKLKFTPRIQRINELEARTRIKLNFIDQLTKFFALKGTTFQIPVVEKAPLDLYTLHRCVKELGGAEFVNKEKKWSEVACKMGFSSKNVPTSLKLHYESLILPFLVSREEKKADSLKNQSHREDRENSLLSDNENILSDPGMLNTTNDQTINLENNLLNQKTPSFRELKSLQFLGPGPKMAVFDGPVKTMKTRTRGKKILYEFDPLAKYMCKSCCSGDIEESLVTCVTCEDRYHAFCLIPPLKEKPIGNWKCPKCFATEVSKPLEEFGFAQAEKEYTLNEFKKMANNFKQQYFKTTPTSVPTHKVEEEFWRVVSSIEESVTVEYGADLHVIDHGSGFPIRGKNENNLEIDLEAYHKYAESSWNLNNLPVLKASVLRHISADISGMKIPWMYAGMCFATFCWHNEDHWSYSINYLHLGEPKTWYGVSGDMAEEFEEAMKAAAPELFESQPDILHQLVTIMNPNDIMAAGVPVYRTDQKEGEFVITFPRAYHAGFNQGFNFAEACNFAPYDWLEVGRECISHYSSLGRPCVFSHDELVCKMALMADELDGNIAWATIKDGKAMLNAERIRRHIITKQGVYKALKTKFEDMPDDERQCAICNTTCFLSGVACPCNESRLVCLEHVSNLCRCPYNAYIMKYQYQIDEIANILMILENKTLKFNMWLSRVEKALSGNSKPKITLRGLTELLIEANDKELPRNDLIVILHYHVSKCFEVSALARTILGKSKMKSKFNQISPSELELFANEIDNLPCTIVEVNAIKQLLTKAKHFQQLASKALSLKHVKKARIIQCINLAETMHLDFAELPLLHKKLREYEWLEKAEEVTSNLSLAEQETLEHLIKSSDEFSSLAVQKQKEPLIRLLDSIKEWVDKINDLNLREKEIDDVENILNELNRLEIKIPNIPSKTKLLNDLQEAKQWQEKVTSILNGNVIIYISEVEELISKGLSMPFKLKVITELKQSLEAAKKWKDVVSNYFLKPNCSYTLMQSLWPRKFLPRSNFYQNSDVTVEEESLINEGEHNFDKNHFKAASYVQWKSLHQLRALNLLERAKRKSENPVCVCGSIIDGEIIVCELCQSPYHRTCFRVDENIVKSYIYGFRAKIICSICTRTKRPSINEISSLIESGEKLKINFPEFIVLKHHFIMIKKWQREARNALSSHEMIEGLNAVLGKIKKKCVSLNQTEGKLSNLVVKSLENLNMLGRANVENSNLTYSDASISGISREALLNLRQCMMLGDSYEISTVESSQMWILIDASKSVLICDDNFIVPVIETSNDQSDCLSMLHETQPKTPLNYVKKRPMKQKVKKSKPTSGSKSPKLQKQKVEDLVINKSKKCIRQKNTLKKGSAKQSKGGGIVEEHDLGESCAAGINCLLPGDIDENVHWVQCDGKCRKWFHMKCVDLTQKEVTEDDEFICLPCLGHSKSDEEEVDSILLSPQLMGDPDETDPLL